MADIAEKLGVGFVLGVIAQGIFRDELSSITLGLALVVLVIAGTLLTVSIYLSSER